MQILYKPSIFFILRIPAWTAPALDAPLRAAAICAARDTASCAASCAARDTVSCTASCATRDTAPCTASCAARDAPCFPDLFHCLAGLFQYIRVSVDIPHPKSKLPALPDAKQISRPPEFQILRGDKETVVGTV